MSSEAERELEAIRAKMARGELDPDGAVKLGDFWGVAPNLTGGDTVAEFVEKVRAQAYRDGPGLGAVLGKWPGDETDEEINAALHPDLPPYFDPEEVVE